MITDTKKRVLAIDYGSKRIGVAISDPLCLFPSITFTLQNDKNVFPSILKIILEKNINKIVLGYPDNESKSTIQLAKEIIKFKCELELKSKIAVDLWDEQLTSQIASERIINSVIRKSKRRDKALVDAQSAAIILEEYLNSLTGR